jgi:hypothetical protein
MYLNPRHFACVKRSFDGRRQSRLRKDLQLSGWDSPLIGSSQFPVLNSVEICCVYLTTET